MIKRYREQKLKRQLDVELDAYYRKAAERRKWTQDTYRDWRDFLRSDEYKDFRRKVQAHDILCRRYDNKRSDWFDLRRDLPDDPKSPPGLITVQTNRSSKVEFKREMDGLIYQYRDGVREELPVPPTALGVR